MGKACIQPNITNHTFASEGFKSVQHTISSVLGTAVISKSVVGAMAFLFLEGKTCHMNCIVTFLVLNHVSLSLL